MLSFATDVSANSRLACQIAVTDALDGLTVRIPERQR
jgi:2Fe-2S ferredoxin